MPDKILHHGDVKLRAFHLSKVLLLALTLFKGTSAAADGDQPMVALPTIAESTVTISAELLLPPGFESSAPVAGVVSATWYGPAGVQPVAVPLRVGEVGTLKLVPGRWKLEAKVPGWWSAPEQVELGAQPPLPFRLRLWPAGTVEGGLRAPEGEEPPRDFALFFRPAPDAPKNETPPPGSTVCPLREGRWSCEVPVGRLDARLQVSGFVPRYLWGLNAIAGQTVKVGTTDLVRGSVVQGWVVNSSGGLPRSIKVSIEPRGTEGLIRARSQASSLRQVTSVNDRGFFEFDAVAPGEYRVEATAEGSSAAQTTVRVQPRQVTEISNPPLTLTEPLTFTATMSPPLDPWGEPWRLELLRLDRASMVFTRDSSALADSGGTWVGKGLRAGTVMVTVSPSTGGVWWSRELSLENDMSSMEIALDLVEVTGSLRLGERPLAGQLFFGGKNAEVRVETSADTDGKFALFLPRAGDWKVAISAAQPQVERELAKVMVRPATGTRKATLSLRLPDTKLEGRVVDESGAGVRGALVFIEPLGPPQEAPVYLRTDPRGEFEARGLPAGSVRLDAEAGLELRADSRNLSLTEGTELPQIELVLRKSLTVDGIVGSSAGPLAGATVKALPVGFSFLGVPVVVSSGNGDFQLRLPRQAREIQLSASAPGFALRILRQPLPGQGPLTIGLRQESGTLILETHEAIDWRAPNAGLYVLHGGGVESLGYLVNWAFRNGVNNSAENPRRVVVPFLEPGDYTVCLADAAQRAALDQGILPVGRCTSGTLRENDELSLTLDTE